MLPTTRFLPASQTLASSRIAAVDAARGCAMLMVFLSHIKQHFDDSAPTLYWALTSTTRIATPTFLLLSGFVIRHLLKTDRRGDASIMLFDRALFLLIVAHALLGLSFLPELGVMRWAFERAWITDAVGVALIVAVFVRNGSARALAAAGVTLCIVSWIAATTVSPESEWGQLVGGVLFQLSSSRMTGVEAPIVAYVGVFLLGMALNAHVEEMLENQLDRLIARRLFRYGIDAIALSIVGILVWHVSKHYVTALVGDPDLALAIRETLDPRIKSPPSPAYLLFYGGAGLLLLALFFNGWPARILQPVMRKTAVIGRASLMCFVVQDWIFLVVPEMFGLNTIHSVSFWLLYLATALVVLYALAWQWGRVRGNRFLTVGLRALVQRVRLRRAERIRLSSSGGRISVFQYGANERHRQPPLRDK